LPWGTVLPLAALGSSAPAQDSSGQIVGRVSNTAGETVSRATVIVSAPNGRTHGIAITDSQGAFGFSGIPAGTYVLQVFGNGFGPSLRTTIELRKEQNVRQDVTLDIVSKDPVHSGDSPQLTKQYAGDLVSIDVNDLDIRAFFRWIHEASGITIAVDSDARERLLDRTVTLNLKNVPWDQVLDLVLMKYGLSAQNGADAIRISLNRLSVQ
jgi:Carboxypeptidase regulatory-like domain/Secretin and TonB N terminus short domain